MIPDTDSYDNRTRHWSYGVDAAATTHVASLEQELKLAYDRWETLESIAQARISS